MAARVVTWMTVWTGRPGAGARSRDPGARRQTSVRAARAGTVLRGHTLRPTASASLPSNPAGTWMSRYRARLPPKGTEPQAGEAGLLRARRRSWDRAFRLALPLESVALNLWLVVSLLGAQAPLNRDEITQTSVPPSDTQVIKDKIV